MLFAVSAKLSIAQRAPRRRPAAPASVVRSNASVRASGARRRRSWSSAGLRDSRRGVVRRSSMQYRVSGAAMNTVDTARRNPLPALGLGTWHMGEAARTRAAEIAARAARDRDRLPRDRHRRDVRRGRRRGGRRRRRWPRRCAPATSRATSCSSSARSTRTTPAAPAWRRPASAACSRLGSTASISTCCTGPARIRCARRSPASRRCRPPAASATGASAISIPTTWCELVARAGRRALRGQPGLLLAERARRRVRPAAVAARSARCR